MVTRNRPEVTTDKADKKGRVRLGKLELNRETVRDLTGDEQRRIKGGPNTVSGAVASPGGFMYFGCISDKYPNQ
ncbi:MAG TPA: hypothetical protein VGV38_15770 [Pyrinomonadaceae bacterium]|nr:hypothetical protein [Pyrinomonadaceae bacterium]